MRFNGANLDYLIARYPEWRSQPWRLFTCTLLHGGVLHLIFNVYWIAIFGVEIEERLGTMATGVIVLLLGVPSSAAQVAFTTGGIGLSGIGYGLFGLLWILDRRDSRFRGTMDSRTAVLFVVWFFVCIVATLTDTMSIGNVAHGVGALVGGLIGWGIADRHHGDAWRFSPLVVVFVLVGGAASFGLRWTMTGDGRGRMFETDATRAYDAGHFAEAARLTEAMLVEHPDEFRLWWNLAVYRMRLEQPDAALQALERAGALGRLDAEQSKTLETMREYVRARR